MATNRPTVYDVAERAGVSIATVSFTFRRPQQVKESTRRAVYAAARELGYIPSASARGLAGGRTRALGLLSLAHRPADSGATGSRGSSWIGWNEDLRQFPLYVDEVQRGVEQECWRHGYALMVAGANSANREAVLTDIAGRVDALAVFSGTAADSDLQRIADRLPVVVLCEPRLDDGFQRIGVDNASGIRALVEHLVNTHRIRDLAFVGPIYDSDRAERFAAFQAALADIGLAAPSEPLAPDGDHRDVVRGLISRAKLPGAFVCVTDEVALDLMDALRELDVEVPGRVAVTGFDGIVAGRLASPRLTTVRQPMAAIGAEVVKVLIELVERPSDSVPSRVFPVDLVIRESCGCQAT